MLRQFVRVSYRGTFFSVHLVSAIIICIFLPIILKSNGFEHKSGKAITQWWSRRAAAILGLCITQQGKPISSTSLIVANHISFLDIIVIASSTPVIFLSKSTLRYWPFIGFIAKRIGTIFIHRNNKHQLHSLTQSLTKTLKQEQTLVLFPEGTTTTGGSVKNFHTSLFQAAINAAKPVQPVALSYVRDGMIDPVAAYIDTDNFIINLVRIMSQKKTVVRITYCNLIDSNNMNRRELALTSQRLISNVISV